MRTTPSCIVLQAAAFAGQFLAVLADSAPMVVREQEACSPHVTSLQLRPLPGIGTRPMTPSSVPMNLKKHGEGVSDQNTLEFTEKYSK